MKLIKSILIILMLSQCLFAGQLTKFVQIPQEKYNFLKFSLDNEFQNLYYGKLDVTNPKGYGTFTFTGNASFSGNVGIGTTNPTEKLEVNGNIKCLNGWTQYTPSTGGGYTANSTTGYYMTIGKMMFLQIQVSTFTANGSGAYSWSIPDGYTINNTVAYKSNLITDGDNQPQKFGSTVGTFVLQDWNGGWYRRGDIIISTTNLLVCVFVSNTADRSNVFGSSTGISALPAVHLNITVQVPIN